MGALTSGTQELGSTSIQVRSTVPGTTVLFAAVCFLLKTQKQNFQRVARLKPKRERIAITIAIIVVFLLAEHVRPNKYFLHLPTHITSTIMVRPDRKNPKHHFFGRGGIANILREGSTCTALLEQLKDLYNSDDIRQSEKRDFVKDRVYDHLKRQGGEFFVVQQLDSRDKTSMSRDEILDAAADGAQVCTENDALAKLMQSLRDTKKMKVTPSGKKSFSSGGPRGRPRKYTHKDSEDGGSTVKEEDKNTKSKVSRSAAKKAKTKATVKKKAKTESLEDQKQQYQVEEEAEGYAKVAALTSSSSSNSNSRNKKRPLPAEADEIQMAAASLKRMVSSGSGGNSRHRKIVKLTQKNPRESLMKHRLDKILNANTNKTAAAAPAARADSSYDDASDDSAHLRSRDTAPVEKEKETIRRPRKKFARAAASSTKSMNNTSMCSLCGGGACRCEILDVAVLPTRRSDTAAITSSPSSTVSSRCDSDREGVKQQHPNSSGRPSLSRNGTRNKNEQDRDPIHDDRDTNTINTSSKTAPDTLEAAQRRVRQLEEQIAELTQLQAAQRRIQQQNDEIKKYKLTIEEQNDTIEQQRQHNQQLQRRIQELELEKEEQQIPSPAVSVSV